jgi:glycosyltransferase involved in cell wall biosynthesis
VADRAELAATPDMTGGTAGPGRLHVLAWGSLGSGVTDSLRLGSYVAPLAARGVEVRSWSEFGPDVPAALEWAHVALFRRWRPTHTICTECESAWPNLAALETHVRSTGHRTMVPDLLLRPVVDLLASHPELRRSRAIVYDTDDDVLDYPDWTGFAGAAARERDVVLRILGMADLVTVTTPVLAERLAAHTPAPVRVVRNAVDPAWYAAPESGGVADDRSVVRVVYHGVPVRLRDYEVARPGVEAAARAVPGLRRIWIGAAEEPRVAAVMDEVRPWVDGLAEFGRVLSAARPDVGLAPLLDEPFNRAKSELHWLEYAMAGAPTVVSGLAGGGPFDAVRDGVDGLVAREPGDWRRHVRSLAASPDLRTEIAGRARERVLAGYTVAGRADEWAEAFRWAADRAGSGGARVAVAGADPKGSERAEAARPDAEQPDAPQPDAERSEADLRVLVVGPGSAGVSDSLRFEAMRPALARLGIELVCWTPPDPAVEADPFAAVEAALDWSDVVVLRRHYRTWHACLVCGRRTLDAAEASGHARETGHSVVLTPYSALRPLVQVLEGEPGVLGGRAIVYDTDDDVFAAELPAGAEDWLERDLVARILKIAGLVTAATPILADRLRALTGSPVRVVRNALDPAWYEAPGAGAAAAVQGSAGVDDLRVVYHGVAAHLSDYEVARPAVDAFAAATPSVRKVWLGAAGDPRVEAAMDEVGPWISGAREFAAVLAGSRPDIGLAPLADTPYNLAKSELHWLEYALAGAPAIVSGFEDPGPFDPVRDGVDGLIARTGADWGRHLRSLGGSGDLRAEVAGRARERVLSGYTVDVRAAEWADVYTSAVRRSRAAQTAARGGNA